MLTPLGDRLRPLALMYGSNDSCSFLGSLWVPDAKGQCKALLTTSHEETTKSHGSITNHRQDSIQRDSLVPSEWMRIDFFS